MMQVLEKKQSQKIIISLKNNFHDPKALEIIKASKEYLHKTIEAVQVKQIYDIHKKLSQEQLLELCSVLSDPVLNEVKINDAEEGSFDWKILISFKPSVCDNTGRIAQVAIEDYLKEHFSASESVHSQTLYLFKGKLSFQDMQYIAKEILANDVIEDIYIEKIDSVFEEISFDKTLQELLDVNEKRQLALNKKELLFIKTYFQKDNVALERKKLGLPKWPTDVEIEAIAQTWSEHCKHKIFNAKILFNDSLTIDSLFKTYIKKATDEISKDKDWLVSVFSDNAGIIQFTDKYNIAFKVETHNSPSALDPYGGALTGILGVNRDILGAGIGAKLIANTDVFCFAPHTVEELPEKIMHPKRIFEGVRKGVEHGGNKTGVPTVNGAILFEERYLGKPLVYCGSVGIMPRRVGNVFTHEKQLQDGDLIVIAGGKTGRDGIHGATFSSLALNENSPTSAVQIGDPFTQKKLQDFLLKARDRSLFRTLTDNGAGGVSSSVGELAILSGGCELHLDRALLKDESLKPWEILVSESQERMTFAVDESDLEEFQKLAKAYEVDICVLGTFTSSGYFHVLYNNKTVAWLDLEFLHDATPVMELEAKYSSKNLAMIYDENSYSLREEFTKVLSNLNVCSKESVIRQYDHEVQAGSVIKPLVGLDGPSDAAVVRPVETIRDNEKKAIVLSNGICPKFGDLDAYRMAASAIDEALRNYICVGGDIKKAAILDNFCWPDPVYDSEKTPDGKEKLGALVRSAQALYDFATYFSLPIISGKDSMKNDYKFKDTKISVPYTLLISLVGTINDYEKAISMEFKYPGDAIYLIGITRKELGKSEWALRNKIEGGSAPFVSKTVLDTYEKLSDSIQKQEVASCHDLSDGGLAVALAESSFSGGWGANIDISHLITEEPLNSLEKLFSESNSRFLITTSPAKEDAFLKTMQGQPVIKLGAVSDTTILTIKENDQVVMVEDIDVLKKAWQRPFNELD
ncbi:MAG: phosphoribosylformylglycinamidine synthase subunit PurL [Chlamydiota bacterium]|jgi:phosphoribosylformylglycinamidine synthase